MNWHKWWMNHLKIHFYFLIKLMKYCKVIQTFQISGWEVLSFEKCLVVADKPGDLVFILDGKFNRSKSRIGMSSRLKLKSSSNIGRIRLDDWKYRLGAGKASIECTHLSLLFKIDSIYLMIQSLYFNGKEKSTRETRYPKPTFILCV